MIQGIMKKEHTIRLAFIVMMTVIFMFAAGMIVVHADDAGYPQGEQNGVHWVIKEGVLIIGNGDDVTVTMDTGSIMTADMWGWNDYRDQITDVYFIGKIKAKGALSAMFNRCTNLEYIDNTGHLDTSEVTSMYAMFGGCKSLPGFDLSWMDVSSCHDFQSMFAGCSSLELIRLPFNMNGNMAAMFSNCNKLKTIDLSTAKGAEESMYNMFFYCGALENVYFPDDFDTSSVTNMESTFSHCENLKNVNVLNWDTSKVTKMDAIFSNCKSLETVDVSRWNVENVTTFGSAFAKCESLKAIDVSKWNTGKANSFGAMFSDCESLAELDASNFDTGNATDLHMMFDGCKNVKSLDVSSFSTGKVKKMSAMFIDCESLTEINVSSFNTSNVTDMGSMFGGCKNLKALDLSNFDTSNVTKMGSMFSLCGSLTDLDISRFDTSKVTDFGSMFDKCSSIPTLDLSNFDTASATDMSWMFNECSSLKSVDVSSFDTSKVTDMMKMFSSCTSLTSLDISNFDMTNVTGCIDFVKDSKALADIRLGDKCRFEDRTEDYARTRIKDMSGAVVSTPTINDLNEYDPAYSGWYHCETAEEPSGPPSGDDEPSGGDIPSEDTAGGDTPAPAEIEIEEGTVEPYNGSTYTITSSAEKTVVFTQAKNTKTVTVPSTVTLSDGKVYTVTSIGAKAFKGKKIRNITINKNIRKIDKNAFYGSKVTTITVKTKLLKKASVKGSLKGSKVKTIRVRVGSKKQNKTYIKKYKKYFTKANAGKKVTVK